MATNKLITIQLFKYDEKTSEKCQHYTTAAFNIYDGNYEKLLKECNYELLLILN